MAARVLLIQGASHKTEVTKTSGIPFRVAVYQWDDAAKDYDCIDCEHAHSYSEAARIAKDLHNFYA